MNLRELTCLYVLSLTLYKIQEFVENASGAYTVSHIMLLYLLGYVAVIGCLSLFHATSTEPI